jgi:hypothetical protein
MKPTEEQKKFWEWCGWRQVPEGKKAFHYERCQKVMNWYAPDNQERSYKFLPDVDLNSIFKWAVPKIADSDYYIELYHDKPIFVASIYGHDGEYATVIRDKDPALALFWAIYMVIENDINVR